MKKAIARNWESRFKKGRIFTKKVWVNVMPMDLKKNKYLQRNDTLGCDQQRKSNKYFTFREVKPLLFLEGCPSSYYAIENKINSIIIFPNILCHL